MERRITELTAIEASEVSETDEFVIVDRSDNAQADSGTAKRINAKNAMSRMFVEDDSYPVDWEFGHPTVSVLFGIRDLQPQPSNNHSNPGVLFLTLDAFPPTTATFYENQGTVRPRHNTTDVIEDWVEIEPTYTIGNGTPWNVIYLDTDTNTAWVDDGSPGTGNWIHHIIETYLDGAGPPTNGVTDGELNTFYYDTDNDDLWYCNDGDIDTWSVAASLDGEFDGGQVDHFTVGTGDPSVADATWLTGATGDYYINVFISGSDPSFVYVCTDGGPPSVWTLVPNDGEAGAFNAISDLAPEAGTIGSPTGHGPGSMLIFICTDDDQYGGNVFFNSGTADGPIWQQFVDVGFID